MAITFEQFLQFRGKSDQAIATVFDASPNDLKQMRDFASAVEAGFNQQGRVPTTADFLAAWQTKIATPFGLKPAAPGERLAGQVPAPELADLIAQRVFDKVKSLLDS